MNTSSNRTTLTQRGERKTGGLLARTSQAKKLLADEETVDPPITMANQQHTVSNPVDSQDLLDKLLIDYDDYDYPREEKVPAGWYFSTITEIKAREKDDRVIVDIGYTLEDRYGAIRYIRQSYPVGSQPYNALSKALVAAGLKKRQKITAAGGTTEMVRVDYVSKRSDIGSIVERKPYELPPEEEPDADDEYDDFLSTEDE